MKMLKLVAVLCLALVASAVPLYPQQYYILEEPDYLTPGRYLTGDNMVRERRSANSPEINYQDPAFQMQPTVAGAFAGVAMDDHRRGGYAVQVSQLPVWTSENKAQSFHLSGGLQNSFPSQQPPSWNAMAGYTFKF